MPDSPHKRDKAANAAHQRAYRKRLKDAGLVIPRIPMKPGTTELFFDFLEVLNTDALPKFVVDILDEADLKRLAKLIHSKLKDHKS